MSNYNYVKKYELKQKERGLYRQKVWIPDTPEAKKELLKFGAVPSMTYLIMYFSSLFIPFLE